MIERLLILLPTPMMLPPITGASETNPEGVALAASSADTALLPCAPDPGCPAFVVPGVALCWAFDWPCAGCPNPEAPKPVCCALAPASPPGWQGPTRSRQVLAPRDLGSRRRANRTPSRAPRPVRQMPGN